MLKAVTRSARLVDQRVAAINDERASRGQSKISVAYYFDHYGTDQDTQVTVVEEDFMRAREELTPSVSLDELRHYERVRNTFEGATKKEDANADGDASRTMPGNTDPEQNGQAMRSRAMEAMKRASKSKVPTMNGGPHSHSHPHMMAPGPHGNEATPDPEEDYVIRTDKLSLNDHAGKVYVGKGKGKGKSNESAYSPHVSEKMPGGIQENGDGGQQPEGEDLYD